MNEKSAVLRFLVAAVLAAAPFLTCANAAAQNANSAPKSASASGNAENGHKLFLSDGCYECHGRQAQGGAAGPRLGPGPLPLPAILKYVRQPTGQMPPYTSKVISDAELADIYAFLQSLPQPPRPESIPALK
jgi:ubiquinol-cytochrome c reductase cytochrome c subunit